MKAWRFLLLSPLTCSGATAVDDPSLTVGGNLDSNGTLPTAIVIMAQGRSGSTMLAELFRANQVCHM